SLLKPLIALLFLFDYSKRIGQGPVHEYPGGIIRARHEANQREPFLVVGAIDELADRLQCEFAGRLPLLLRRRNEAGRKRKIIERKQHLTGNDRVFKLRNHVAEQHAPLLQWTCNAAGPARAMPSICAAPASRATYCAIARRWTLSC